MTDKIDVPTSHTEMKPTKPTNDLTESLTLHLKIGFRQICFVTASLPLVTLFLCFIYAVVFQANEVHETHCQVYNIIPSISAITGISPQRYFWRISIALHIGPRYMLAACYRNLYTQLMRKQFVAVGSSSSSSGVVDGGTTTINNNKSAASTSNRFVMVQRAVFAVFWLHIIEITALCGVTYVSNRENYPLHEKIFITFMVCSLCHMLATIKLQRYLNADGVPPSGLPTTSLLWKKRLFALSIVSTIGLLIFFVKHRFYCHDMAFSWFSAFEYVIAVSNLAFHCTAIWDFHEEHLIIVHGGGKLKVH